jgi:hypothetical protein
MRSRRTPLVFAENTLGNLMDGEGPYSLVTLESTEGNRTNHAFGRGDFSAGHRSYTYQRDNFSFGGGITTGMTEEEFNNYYYDSATGSPINGGSYKDGKILDDAGRDYKSSYGFCFTTGTSNVNKGRASFVGGENSNNHGKNNFNYGQGINNFGNYSVMLGGDCVSPEVPSRIKNRGNYNFFFGRTGLSSYSDQFKKECSNVILLGSNLKATNDNQVIVGANSGFTVEGTPNLRFAVATGSTPETGTNGFEIYEGGELRSYSNNFRIGSIVGSKFVVGEDVDGPYYRKTVSINESLLVEKDTAGPFDSSISILSHYSGWYSPIYDFEKNSLIKGKTAFEIYTPTEVPVGGSFNGGYVRSYFEPKNDFDIIRKIDLDTKVVNTSNLKLTAVGSKGNPIYINEEGKPSACGFRIKVNGTEVSLADINFITG